MAFFQQSNKEKKTSLRAKLGLKNIDSNIENKKQKNKQQGIDNENLDAAFSYVKNELPQYVLEPEPLKVLPGCGCCRLAGWDAFWASFCWCLLWCL